MAVGFAPSSRSGTPSPPQMAALDGAQSVDEARQPFAGEKPASALSEIFLASAMPDADERLWVPQTESVSFRPLCLSVSSGFYVNLLRVRGAGLLSRHRHPGPVHAYVLKGRWRYLEHDWVAEEGSLTGALLYCDRGGKVVGAEDVFSKLKLAQEHYEAVGLGARFVERFVR